MAEGEWVKCPSQVSQSLLNGPLLYYHTHFVTPHVIITNTSLKLLIAIYYSFGQCSIYKVRDRKGRSKPVRLKKELNRKGVK